ncbi:MAG TPA: tetratricopeptide repeat protein [Casimicrobiaceae bacterium]|nr:tetratricopeptide repeat protein [Casimicrobiaceae bacterium]
MKRWTIALISMLLAACASAPAPPGQRLFRDELFAAPSERISADDVFALSDDMQQYLRTQIAGQLHSKPRERALVDALYSKKQLKLQYDAEFTRDAAQTFAARAGNCLSLVIMTAAFAKDIGIPVRYQMVLGDPVWSRSGGMYFSISHVDLTLGVERDSRVLDPLSAELTIDFFPGEDLKGQRLRVVSEETIVAMYMNNRAAESLAEGKVDNAYWWAHAAIEHDPKFLSAYNTLALVYRRYGNLQDAEGVLGDVLKLEPANTNAMSNLALVLDDEGRVAEAGALRSKLAKLEPYPPFWFFDRGLAALRNGDFREAKDLFEREVQRDAYYHEFRFWLGIAYLGLGQTAQARAQLALALENSTTRGERDLYAAKLAAIKAHRSLLSGEDSN